MNKVFVIIFISFILIYTQKSFSQGHVGGGDSYASDFQTFINKIDAYLLTPEGRRLFPEIKQPEFHEIVRTVRPVVKDEQIYDSFGVSQTCVSKIEENNRFFQCDLKRLPPNIPLNQPTLYRLVFHELLFQVGLETPIGQDVPSDFRISSRLKLYMETYDEWVPGETPGGWRDTSALQKACEIYALNKLDNSEEKIWKKLEYSELNALECLVKAYDIAENFDTIDVILFDKELNLTGRFKIRK